MFQFTFSAELAQLDLAKITKGIQNAMRIRMRNAARAFVRAAVQQNLVPIQTGMARGTFLNIGRLLKVAIPLSGARFTRINKKSGTVRKGSPIIYYYGPDGKILKTPQAGAALATQTQDIFSDNGAIFNFHYGNDVIHYNINDFFPRVRGAPWGSYEAGAEAFIADMQKNLPKYFPQLLTALATVTITGGPNGYTRTIKVPPDGDTEPE